MQPGFEIAFFTMIQLPRRKVSAGLAVLIASIGIFSAEAYLLLRFSAHDMFAPAIADFFFTPVDVARHAAARGARSRDHQGRCADRHTASSRRNRNRKTRRSVSSNAVGE